MSLMYCGDMENQGVRIDSICAYCTRSADHLVGSVTVCDYSSCAEQAKREQRSLTPVVEFLAELAARRDQ